MRKAVLAVTVAATFHAGTAIARYEPKFSDVCLKSEGGTRQYVDKNLLVQFLLKDQGLFPIDIDTTGNFTNEMGMAAVRSNGTICDNGKCGEGAKAQLGGAHIELLGFFSRSAKPVAAGAEGYQIVGVNPGENAPLDSYLDMRGVLVECVVKPAASQAVDVKPPTKPPKVPQTFMIRASIDDLSVDKSEEAFKSLERATVSVNDDLRAHSDAIGIDATGGWKLGKTRFGKLETEYWQTILFASYKRQYVDGANPAAVENINNVAFGVVGDVFFHGGIYHDIQFAPKILHAIKSGADIFSGTLTYAPMPGWAVIGVPYSVIPGLASFEVKPQGKLVYGHVFDDGGNPNLSDGKEFGRGGGRVEAILSAQDGTWLEGTNLSTSYEYLRVFHGPLNSAHRFEWSFNYGVPKSLIGFQLKYAEGQDLDTLVYGVSAYGTELGW